MNIGLSSQLSRRANAASNALCPVGLATAGRKAMMGGLGKQDDVETAIAETLLNHSINDAIGRTPDRDRVGHDRKAFIAQGLHGEALLTEIKGVEGFGIGHQMVLSVAGRANAPDTQLIRHIGASMVNNRKNNFPKIKRRENDMPKIEGALKGY